MSIREGKVLLIANPAAQNGAGAAAADRAATLLRAALGPDAVVLAKTAGPRHASEIAERAEGCATVLALGGDGIIHEAASGLMRRPANARPVFGIVPAGSGNDYARTLGMSRKVDEACEQLLAAEPHAVDLGRVNGHWFVETLSFGLDAAIALDTVERRKRTGRTGAVPMRRPASTSCSTTSTRGATRRRSTAASRRAGSPSRSPCRSAPLMAAASRSVPMRASTTGCSTSASPILPSVWRARRSSSRWRRAEGTRDSGRWSFAVPPRYACVSTPPFPLR